MQTTGSSSSSGPPSSTTPHFDASQGLLRSKKLEKDANDSQDEDANDNQDADDSQDADDTINTDLSHGPEEHVRPKSKAWKRAERKRKVCEKLGTNIGAGEKRRGRRMRAELRSTYTALGVPVPGELKSQNLENTLLEDLRGLRAAPQWKTLGRAVPQASRVSERGRRDNDDTRTHRLVFARWVDMSYHC